jgi:type I restriction enzyme S subunit
MNADRLLEHFERISDAADAVPRLRRFVLDLAVRGKLVVQDPANETADSILALVGDHGPTRQARERKAFVDSHSTDTHAGRPHDLPSTWKWVKLGDLFNYDAGIKREPRQLDPERWLLELEDIEKDTSRIITHLKVRERDSQSTKSEFLAGDILYGKLRPYLNKVVVADQPGYSTTEIVAIRPKVPMSAEYCRIALQRPDFVRYVERLGRGTKMPRLRTPDALVAPFPLPPLAEQQRIVAKVDELMALCDGLEAAQAEREARRDRLVSASLACVTEPDDTDATSTTAPTRFHLDHFAHLTTRPEHVKQLRQAILNLAVRGRLVPQNPKDDSAIALRDSISAAKAALRQSTADHRIKATPPPISPLPFDIPSAWVAESFENLFLFIDYRGKTPPKTSEGVPLITAKNIRMGFLNREPREFIAPKTFSGWMTRGFPRLGDLFFTTEAPLANVCRNNIDEPFGLAQRVICLQPYGNIDTTFVMYAIMSQEMQSLIDAHASGTTARGIKTAKLKPLPIPLPPLAEQRRIVAKVDELMAMCDQLEASLAAAATDRARLLESLLHEALAPAA